MSQSPMPSVPSQVGGASRLALARLALDVVSTTPGVAGTDAGPGGLCVTADPPFGVLRGVAVIAQPDGRYEVDLCLVARMVPLLPLGEDIRQRLRARAARDGLADELGTVNVEFSQALSADETVMDVLPPDVPVPPETSQGAGGLPTPPAGSTGSQGPMPSIPPADPPALPQEPPPGAASTPIPPAIPASPAPEPPPSAPPPPAAAPPSIGPSGVPPPAPAPPTVPPGPPAVPGEPKGSIGSQLPRPDQPGSSPESTDPGPGSVRESRS